MSYADDSQTVALSAITGAGGGGVTLRLTADGRTTVLQAPLESSAQVS